MELEVFKEREQTTVKVDFKGKTVKELLQQLRINPEVILVVRNHEICTEDELLQEQDRIELLSVISGG